MPIKKRLEILSLGSEFLLGLRDNAQLSYIGRELSRKGLSIARDQEIRDNAEEIRAHFLETWKRADIVMTVGGLGPTSDDMTREVVCGALGAKLVENKELSNSIARRLGDIGIVPTAGHKRQSMIPEGAEILTNKNGTAPGIWLEMESKILIMLPGPGHEMRPIFMEEVLPRLEKRDIALINDAFLQLRACGIVESEVDALVAPVVAPYGARISVSACCMVVGLVDIRIGAADESVTWKDLEAIGDACRARLGDNFIGYGDIRMAEVVTALLREREKTVSVAESCTGGLLSSSFAEIPGVSKVFRGGVVCYNNDVKEEMIGVPEDILQQHGAVSAETAVALALGAQERLDSDYALSVTGYAGPDGGASGSAPVGTIYVGFASPEGVWSRKLFIMGTRQNVRERAVMSALDWMRRRLMEEGREAARKNEQAATSV